MWDFLEYFDKNLLYVYASSLLNGGGKLNLQRLTADYSLFGEEKASMFEAEEIKNKSYYLIWFVYRYVLKCETLEEALAHADMETLRKFNLTPIFKQRYVYIGVYNKSETIYLYKYEDIRTVLEILYGRYGFIQQLECFVRQTTGTLRTTRKKCESIKKKYQEAVESGKLKPLFSMKGNEDEKD